MRSPAVVMSWRVVAALAVTVAIGACGAEAGDRSGYATVPTASSSRTSDTAATTSATTTTLPREEFLRQKVVELFAIRNELLQHPDPARLTEWLSPICPCFEVERRILDDFAANSHRLDGPEVQLIAVRYVDTQHGLAHLTVVGKRLLVQVVDSAGQLVRVRAEEPELGIGVTVELGSAGWRVVDLIDLNLRPEIVQQVREEGLPA